MTEPERIQQIEAALREAGPAHHQADRATNGDDPEWPLWYAEFLQPRIGGLLGSAVTRSELVYLLVAAERARSASDPRADWPSFYARFFIARAGIPGSR